MNNRSLAFALVISACILRSESEGVKPSVARQSSALLKNVFPYQPTANREIEARKEVGSEIVEMKPFVVVDSPLNRDLARHFKRQSQKETDEQFSFTKGGAIYKNERIDIGATPNDDMFKEDAKYREKTPMIKIDLLHLRF